LAHHIAEDGDLEEVGHIQLLLHTLFAKYEPSILRMLDRIIKVGFFRGRGRPILKFMRQMLDILPRGEVVSLQRAQVFMDYLSNSEAPQIAVGPCICQEALGIKKGTHVKDISVLYGTEVYERVEGQRRTISPEEAKKLLEDLHEEGCMHTFYACMKSKGWMVVICNCESEVCLPFRAHQLAGGVLSPGPDIVDWDYHKCVKCGQCVERCHFGANRFLDGHIEVDLSKCYGCGLCISTCSASARKLVERKDYSNMYYPIDFVNRFGDNKES
jgi:ferredoxin